MKIGDRVRVIDYQKGCMPMTEEIGTVHTIVGIDAPNWYTIDSSTFMWREDWLEVVDEAFKINVNEEELMKLFE